VLDHVRVVDAAGARDDQAVIISGDLIWDVVDGGLVYPDDTTVEDWSGHSVVPGLIDSHVHMFYSGAYWWIGDTLAANLQAQLAWGVLGVVDLGSPVEVYDLRDRIAAGEITGPRIWAAGPMLTAEGSHPCETSNDPSLCRFVDGDGAAEVAALSRADGIKVVVADADFTWYPTPRLDLADLADISDAASAANQQVWAHIDEESDAYDALDGGVAVLAHPVFATDLTTTPDAVVHSTIGAFAGTPDLLSGDLLADDLSHTPPDVVANWEWLAANSWYFGANWTTGSIEWTDHARNNTALAINEGRTVLAGSDAGYWFNPHGLALHRELDELVELGMSPLQALTAATAAPAAQLGWDDMGWVAASYRADLLIVNGDPSVDIKALRDIVVVLQGGVAIDLNADVWVGGDASANGAFCLDDRDCAGVCQTYDHVCADDCLEAYDRDGACDESSFCAPADGLDEELGLACFEGDDCNLYDQDCGPAYYGENCVPVDTDTNRCWPSGGRQEGQTCSWTDPAYYCEQGQFCSWISYLCYSLCDPADPGACPGCTATTADGVEWFGLCP
jgi:imidazolonepropionase-like amidohydrolase